MLTAERSRSSATEGGGGVGKGRDYGLGGEGRARGDAGNGRTPNLFGLPAGRARTFPAHTRRRKHRQNAGRARAFRQQDVTAG